jgi:hypothetical protein
VTDSPAGDGSGAQPTARLRGQLRPASRTWLRPLVRRFLRGLCYHYGVELHNFAPNAISQAATFVGVCEGFLRIPANWDLWVELHNFTPNAISSARSCTRLSRRSRRCIAQYALPAC